MWVRELLTIRLQNIVVSDFVYKLKDYYTKMNNLQPNKVVASEINCNTLFLALLQHRTKRNGAGLQHSNAPCSIWISTHLQVNFHRLIDLMSQDTSLLMHILNDFIRKNPSEVLHIQEIQFYNSLLRESSFTLQVNFVKIN